MKWQEFLFIIKGIVLPKNENLLKMYSSSDIQDVDEFISSSFGEM